MDPVELAQLQARLQLHGLLEPVIVQPIPGKKAGFRRVTAAKALGWEYVPARVLARPLAPRERVAMQLTENLQREAIRVRDIVQSIHLLKTDTDSPAAIAEALSELNRNRPRRPPTRKNRCSNPSWRPMNDWICPH